MSVVVTGSNTARPGFSQKFVIDYKNLGTTTSTGYVTMALDPNIQFIGSTPAPDITNGSTLTWNYTAVDPGNGGSIALDIKLPPNVALLGKILGTVTTIYPTNNDVDNTNNTFNLTQWVIGAYDPNDKQVTPQGEGAVGNIPTSTKELLYTVRFQNTGNADAVNIRVTDQLDPSVDVSSFKMISSSHSNKYHIENDMVVWEFNNIHLPDSTTDKPGSQGYVTYSLSVKAALPLGTEIQNAANIYFDFNPAVPTNIVVNTLNNPQIITFSRLPASTYGDVAFALEGTTTSGLTVTYKSSDPSIAQVINGNQLKIVGVGNADIIASQAGDLNYDRATDIKQNLIVNKRDLTIKVIDVSKLYGAANPTFTAVYIGFANGEDATFLTTPPTIVCAADTTTPAGTVSIIPSNATSLNYNFFYQNGTLTIAKASQTITFGSLPAKTQGDAAFTLAATSSSGLAVTYTITSGPAMVSGNTITLTGAGTVTVKASQAGNVNYNPAADVTQSFCVNPGKPSILLSFTDPSNPVLTSSATQGNQWYLNGTLILNATSSTYTTTAVGSYTVQSTISSCASALSDAQVLVVTAIEPQLTSNTLKCYLIRLIIESLFNLTIVKRYKSWRS